MELYTKNGKLNKFYIFLKNIDIALFIIFSLNLTWLILYKTFFLSIETNYNFLVLVGEVYLIISTGIISGYPFYIISYEYPKIKQRIEFNPTLKYYTDKVKESQQSILNLLFNEPKAYENIDFDDYKALSNSFREALKNKIEEQIENKDLMPDDAFEKIIFDFSKIHYDFIDKSNEHFKMFEKFLTIEIIDKLKELEEANKKIFNITRGFLELEKYLEQFSIGITLVGSKVRDDNPHKNVTENIGLVSLELASSIQAYDRLICDINKIISKYE